MEGLTLDQAKTRKVQEFREKAELEYWGYFMEHPDDVPNVAYGAVVAALSTGGAVKADSKNRLIASGNVAPKLRTKCDQVRAIFQGAAETEAAAVSRVLAVTW